MSELKEWLKGRKVKPRSVKELAEIFKGVPYKTISSWVNRGSVPIKADLKEKLYRMTQIDKFMPDDIKKQAIDKVKNYLYVLIDAFEPFKQSNVLRDSFRRAINKNDIAYLSSLLEALLDEKRFQVWNTFQKVQAKEVIKDAGKDNL